MNGAAKWNLGAALLLAGLMLGGCGLRNQSREINLVFDGKRCKASGPQVVEPGNMIIDLENRTDGLVLVDVYRLNAGKTWQDMLGHFGVPGDFELRPEWAHGVSASMVRGNPNAREYLLMPGTYGVVCLFMGGGTNGIWPATQVAVGPEIGD